MGLDSYWRNPETDEILLLDFDPPLRLVGGMFSEYGNGSFRGKVYAPLLEAVTGVSLYQQRISNHVIREMADVLDRTPFDPKFQIEYGVSEQEYRDLQRMFRAYADAGAVLDGWW